MIITIVSSKTALFNRRGSDIRKKTAAMATVFILVIKKAINLSEP